MKTKDLTHLCLWMASKTCEMMSVVTTVMLQVRSAHLIRRGLVLFAVGVLLALVLYFLQIQRKDALLPDEVLDTLFSSAWWILLCCGTAAGEFTLYQILMLFILVFSFAFVLGHFALMNYVFGFVLFSCLTLEL